MKPIVHTPHPVLVSKAARVKKIDKKILRIVADMKSTLLCADNPKGVGLAAPQIGVALQIFIIRPRPQDPIRVCINPEIVRRSEETVTGIPGSESKLEGCLSIPKVWGIVTRNTSVKLRYLDKTGCQHTESFSGFPAIIIQHETDHLNGILFTRRVVEQKGKLYKSGMDEKGKEILEPLEL